MHSRYPENSNDLETASQELETKTPLTIFFGKAGSNGLSDLSNLSLLFFLFNIAKVCEFCYFVKEPIFVFIDFIYCFTILCLFLISIMFFLLLVLGLCCSSFSSSLKCKSRLLI